MTVEIYSPTPLIDSEGIKNYFNALHLDEPAHKHAASFISRITVRSGFIAPLHLLTGVLSRYGEDWQKVLDDYGMSMNDKNDKLHGNAARKIQLFIFDCWLLWGPSIALCNCLLWNGDMALQFGSGDENNSLSVRYRRGVISNALEARNPREAFAWQASVTGRLQWGPSLHGDGICPAQEAIWRDRRLVLDATEDGLGIRFGGGNRPGQVSATYYSAYIWIMFVMCADINGELRPYHGRRKWMDLVPFFAHANIADRDSYDFQSNSLAHSAIQGALQLLKTNDNLHLRFVGAIDETGCGSNIFYKSPGSYETIRSKMQKIQQKMTELSTEKSTLERLVIAYDKRYPFMAGDYSTCRLPEIVQDYYDATDRRTVTKRTGNNERLPARSSLQ